MSFHIPWADLAQLTEFSTDTNYVGPLRDCVARYAQLSPKAQENALVIADVTVALPGRGPTKILERPELDLLSDLSGGEQMRTTDVADLIERRAAS